MKKIVCVGLIFFMLLSVYCRVEAANYKNYYEIYWIKLINDKGWYYQDISMKWSARSGERLVLKINYDNIPTTQSDLRGAIATAYRNWDAYTEYTTTNLKGISDANTVFIWPTATYWKSLFGTDANTEAETILYDTNGKMIAEDPVAAYNSTRRIHKAQILFHPEHTFKNDDNSQKIVTHELGHVLCLGHPWNYTCMPDTGTEYKEEMTNIKSVMHQGVVALTYVSKIPTEYDKKALKTKYEIAN